MPKRSTSVSRHRHFGNKNQFSSNDGVSISIIASYKRCLDFVQVVSSESADSCSVSMPFLMVPGAGNNSHAPQRQIIPAVRPFQHQVHNHNYKFKAMR